MELHHRPDGRVGAAHSHAPAPGDGDRAPPFLDVTVSSANLHGCVYQTDRGEVVIGGGWSRTPPTASAPLCMHLQELAVLTVEMFPRLRTAKVLRQWAGLCDMTPDYAPILGEVEGIESFILSCGWGSWGFKVAPGAGRSVAELVVTGKPPDLIRPFALSKFRQRRLVIAAAPAAAITRTATGAPRRVQHRPGAL